MCGLRSSRPRRDRLPPGRPEGAAMGPSVIRAMTAEDLPGVASVTNAAFGALHARGAGAVLDGPALPALFFAVRFAADPDGCFVAVLTRSPVSAISRAAA